MSRRPDQVDLFDAKTPPRPRDDPQRPSPKPKRATPAQQLTPVARRVIDSSVAIALDDPERLTFQHAVMCQTSLPYHRQSGRLWARRNGNVILEIEAGRAIDPRTGQFGPIPLPFGARARLVILHLNAMALHTGNPKIEVEHSLTAFVKRILGRDPGGRDIRTAREQLTALSTAIVRLGRTRGPTSRQTDSKIIDDFDLWAPKSAEQTTLWSSTVTLGHRYFQSLTHHAVPLDERAVAALAHSATALDAYSWLAHRLHRVPRGTVELAPWAALHEQFGSGYKQLRDFRSFFKRQLGAVQAQYPQARIEADTKGVRLRNSRPPIGPKLISGPGTTL